MWAYRGEFVAVGSDGAAHAVRLWVEADTGAVRLELARDGTPVVRLGSGWYQSIHPAGTVVLTAPAPEAP